MNKFILVLISVMFFTSLYSQDSKILKGHTEDINALAFSNDGKYLYSGGDDEKLMTWDLANMKLFKTSNIGNKIFKIIPLPKNDEIYIVYGSFEGFTSNSSKPFNYMQSGSIFNTLSEKLFNNLKLNGIGAINVEYLPISNKLFSVYLKSQYTQNKGSTNHYSYYTYLQSIFNVLDSKLNPIELFKQEHVVSTTECKSSFDVTVFQSNPITISSNEKYFALTNMEKVFIDNKGKEVTELRVYSIGNNTLKLKLEIDNGSLKQILKFDFNGDNLYFISNKDDDIIWNYNIITGRKDNSFKGHEKRILCLDVHPTNLYLASGSKDNTVIIWDIQKHKALKVLKGHEDNVRSIAFSKDGRYLASGSDDKTIRVWDISNLTNEIKDYALKYDKDVGLAVLTNQEMEKELKTIESKFNPKGEFETTDAYNKRIEDANAEKKSIEDKYNQQLNEARNQKESEIKGFTSEVQNETERKITESIRDTVLKIDKIGTYNADNETFSLTIIFMTENIKIPSSDAIEFKQNYKKAVVRAKKKLNSSLSGWEYYDIYIINPNNNTEYKFR